MSMKFALAVSAVVLIAAPLLAEQPADPFGWLEEIEGAKALDWARAENARTLPVLEGDPRFAQMRAEARSILTSPTRIPTGSIHNGAVYNFWQDDVHVRGVWRRASIASYRTGKPAWETLIDFDQLAKDEGENWIHGQVACLSPEYRRCMVEMSRGGSDSSTWREFDTTARAFVKDGFALPEAKSDVAWVDADTLVVGTDWGTGTLTDSGYPRIVKVWRRGKPLAAASALFEGSKEDVAVRAFVEQDGGAQPFVVRAVSFFEAEHYYAPGLGVPSRLPLPLHSTLEGVLDGRAIFTLREAWTHEGKVYGQGSVVAYDLKLGTAEPVFAANDTQSIETVAVGKTGLVVQYLENVSGKAVRVLRTPQGEWRATPIALPGNGVLKIASAGGGTDDAMLSFESLTSPLTLYYASANGAIEQIFTTPAAYDATDGVDGMVSLEVSPDLAHDVDGTVRKVRLVRVYELPSERVRLDTTTAKVYGGSDVSVLFQRGHSKDHRPDLRQLKVMFSKLYGIMYSLSS